LTDEVPIFAVERLGDPAPSARKHEHTASARNLDTPRAKESARMIRDDASAASDDRKLPRGGRHALQVTGAEPRVASL